jgi:hypothetical protein
MHGVMLQHVCQIVGFKQIIDSYDFNVWKILYRRAKYHSSNAAKPIDTDLDCHELLLE